MSSLDSDGPTKSRQPNLPRRYSTVTIIVHGVGDHSPVDMFHEIRSGIGPSRSADEDESIRVLEVELPTKILSSVPDRCSVSGVQIDTGSESHLIVALFWANTRLRAVPVWTKHIHAGTVLIGSRDDPSTFRERAARMAARPSPSKELLHSTRHTLYKARQYLKLPFYSRGIWTLAVSFVAAFLISVEFIVGVLSLILFPLVPLILAGFTYLLLFTAIGMVLVTIHVLLYHSLGIATGWQHWGPTIIFVGVCLGLCILDRVLVKVFLSLDLAADVAAYVSDTKRRQALIEHMICFIFMVDEEFADSQLIFVGHSLGSVLISQAITNLRLSVPRKCLLLTLGSPLRLMSRETLHKFCVHSLID